MTGFAPLRAVAMRVRRLPYLERGLCVAAVLLLLIAVYMQGGNDIRLSFRATSERAGSLQLYYSDDSGFSESRSQIFAVGDVADRHMTLPISETLSRGVRVDPQPGMNALHICDMTFWIGSSQRPVHGAQFRNSNEVRVAEDGGCTTLTVDPNAPDPQTLLDTTPFQSEIQAANLAAERLVRVLVSLALLLFLAVALLSKWRSGHARDGLAIPSIYHELPRIYLLFALVLGSLFAVVTPPGGVPDEPAHLAKIILVENGQWVGGHEGAVLDPPLSNLLGPFDGFLNPSTQFETAEVLEHASAPLQCRPAKEDFTGSAASYSPTMYTVGAVLLNLSCRADASVGTFFYAARLLNLLLSVTLTFFALRAAGPLSWPIAMFALLPMSLFEQASLTADSMTLGLGFLVTGLHAGLASGHLQRTRRLELAIFVASLALALAKPGAAWLCAGFLLTWPAYRPHARCFAAMCFILILVPWILHATWVLWSSQYGIPRVGIDVGANVNALTEQPSRIAMLVWNTFTGDEGEFLYMSVVGRLGWLDVVMPHWAYSMGYLVLGASLLMKGDAVRDLPMFTKPVALLLGLGAVLIPVAPMYLYWTTQSAEAVQGLQGRYFIPMLAFVACWVAWRAASVRFAVALFSFLVLLVINVTAIYHLVARYYG